MARRSGFTLIELLVVIAIIGILAALTTAAVQRVRERGKDVQARSDIQQLTSAISNFKAKFNVYPPCFGSGPNGTFILRTNYSGMTNSPEYRLLMQMFPRMSPGDNGLRANAQPWLPGTAASGGVGGTSFPEVYLDPNQALVFFLTGGTFTDFSGFSANPARPFEANPGAALSTRLAGGPFWEAPTAASRRKTVANVQSDLNITITRFGGDNSFSREQPWYCDPWGMPYLYFCTVQGNDYPFDLLYTNSDAAVQARGRLAFDIAPFNRAGAIRPYRESNSRFIEPRGFQIISAGKNQLYGTGGIRTPGTGIYALNREGGDDWANFQQTPLGVTD